MSLSGSSNQDYHANRTHLSSSMLKLILKDVEEFNRQWNKGLKSEQSNPAFTEGSFVHSLILEPEKVLEEYAIYEGLRKAGANYEAFVDANKGKVIISIAQKIRCESLYKAYAAQEVAVRLLSTGFSEHTMQTEVLGVPVKARADYINVERGYIVDVKTTSYPSEIDLFKQTLADFAYDLSAALYCQIAYQVYGKLFDFYFVVLSKSDLSCEVYKASTETLSNGAAKVTQAIIKYKQCKDSGLWLDNTQKVSYDTKNYEVQEV